MNDEKNNINKVNYLINFRFEPLWLGELVEVGERIEVGERVEVGERIDVGERIEVGERINLGERKQVICVVHEIVKINLIYCNLLVFVCM